MHNQQNFHQTRQHRAVTLIITMRFWNQLPTITTAEDLEIASGPTLLNNYSSAFGALATVRLWVLVIQYHITGFIY